MSDKKVLNINEMKKGFKDKDIPYRIKKINAKDGSISYVLDRPELARILAEELKYKQYMKNDFRYNGKFYEKIEDEEHLQLEVKKKLDGVIPQYSSRDINEVISLMKMECTVSSVIDNRYICVRNGIIDLEEMKFLKHDAKYFTTFMIDCDYNPMLDMSRWNTSYLKFFFETTFQNDDNLIQQAQEIIAMSLKPNPKKFKKMVCLLGEGSNGKSVYMNLIKALQGDNISTVPLKAIDTDKFALSEMVGVNVNIDADATGSRLEETSNLKKITTGDTVRIECKGKQGKSGILDVLMLVGLNKMPSSSDKSYGFARRFNILPFNSEFTDEIDKIDESKHIYGVMPELEYEIITNELDLLLTISIGLLKQLQKRSYRLTKSSKVDKATEDYQLMNDTVLAFVTENKGGSYTYEGIKAKILYEYYCDWCSDNECTPVTSTNFGKSFSKYYKKEKRKQGIYYTDVTLNDSLSMFS